MKKIVKIMLISIALGIILMVVGYASGAKMHIYLEDNKVKTMDLKKAVFMSEALPSVSNVSVDIKMADIEFLAAKGEPKIEFYDNGRYGWEMDDDKLEIYEDLETIINIGVDFSFLFGGRNKNLIKVYLPEDVYLDEFEVENYSGDIRINGINSDEIYIKLISGDVNVKNLTSNYCEVELVSGDVKMSDINMEELVINNISGDCEISGSVIHGIYNSTSGDVELVLEGSLEDYSKEISMVSGDLYINGKKTMDSEIENQDPDRHIRIESISGDVELEFKE